MEHPLLSADNKALRLRVLQLIKEGYSVPRSSNILFVCGGNAESDMRPRFLTFCNSLDHEFEIFQPEFAMENIFSDGGHIQFNIADFESLVGELSRAIVVFPEAPGSFAETGYFSAIERLAKKTVLVLDVGRQKGDSFISMGPAKLIEEKSLFYPVIQSSYSEPDFMLVFERIRNRHKESKMKFFEVNKFSDLTSFELLCLVLVTVELLQICTVDNVEFILDGIFKRRTVKKRILQIFSVLVGADFLRPAGQFGHFVLSQKKSMGLRIRDGFLQERNAIVFELAEILLVDAGDLNNLLESAE